jgi:hypothetical protein
MEPLKKIQVEGFAMFAEPELLFGNLDELCCVSHHNVILSVIKHKAGENIHFFLRFPNLFAICIDTFKNTISKWCVGKRGRVEEFSVAPLRDKRVKTLCGCRDKKGTN